MASGRFERSRDSNGELPVSAASCGRSCRWPGSIIRPPQGCARDRRIPNWTTTGRALASRSGSGQRTAPYC